MPFRKFFWVISLLLATVTIWARTLEDIKRSGKIYVAFTFDDLNNINYDLALEFARYLNVELIKVEISWEEVFMKDGVIPPGLETDPDIRFTPDALKKADIICSTFTILEWRKKLFSFARTLQSAELLMVGKDEPIPEKFGDLSGKRIAFVGSTTFEQHLEEINATLEVKMELVPTKSSAETRQLLLSGNVNGIVLDADEALDFTASSGREFRIAFPISEITRTAWAVEKNNPLASEVENFMETIISNGVLDAIFYREFGITYSSYTDRLSKNLKLEIYHRSLEEILASGKLVVALRDRNFVYRQNGQKQFMHALAEEFADHLGVSLEFVVTPYFEKYWETADGRVVRDSSYTPDWFYYFDLACEVFAPLEWRTRKIDMVPVYPSAYAVIARKDTEINSLEDLEEMKGVTGSKTVYEDILQQNGITHYYYEEFNQFIPDVASGKADYTIVYDAFYELSAFPELEVKLELGELEVSWGLRKDQPELEREVRDFMTRSREKGLIGILLKALGGKALQTPEAFLHSYYESFQTGHLPYVNYGAEDGLPQEDIFSIFQDRKGYLWFGTNSGAVRYNGRDMVVFDELNGLPGNSVRDIQQDSSGTLYFATTSGVAKFREDTTVEILFEGIPFQRIYIDSQDRRWLIGSDGVYMEDPEGAIRFINAEFPLLPEVVYHITEDPSTGNLLMATLSGVFLYDPVKEIVRQLSDTDSYSLYIDPNDSIWISTREGLLITHKEDLMFPGKTSEISNLNKRLLFPVQIISSIISNKYGAVWLVTDSRIIQVLSTDQEPIIYEQEIGIKNNKILSFLIDREDNLWIGFSGGLQRLTNRKGLRNFYPTTINSYIYSVFQDEEGRIWIASDNGIFYLQEDQLVNFTSRTGDGNSQFAGTLLPNGNILLASNKGLIEVDQRDLQILRRVEFGQVTHSLENVFAASSGEIFLMTGISGVIYYFPYMGADPVELKNRFTANIYQLLEYHGKVVGGNSTGFVAFNGNDFVQLQETPCRVWSLHRQGNDIWVGTDCGIGRIREGRFDQLELFRLEQNLVIKSIVQANNRNYLWLGTNKGFGYFHMERREFEFIISTRDGLSGDEISPEGLFLDQNDILWIGTYHGLSNFNIRAKSTINYAPVCYIEKLFLNGEQIEAETGQVFPHDKNNFVFEINALSFSDEASVEYEYYLRGTGNNYSSYHRGSEYRAYYNNLPPGTYEFVYKAKGKNNIWGYAEKFEFTIRKAWHQTWLFRMVLVMFFLLAIYLFYIIRMSTLKAQKQRLEEQVRERTHELEVANTEIEAQRDFARYQRDQISLQKKAIMDSIQYAQTIQNSLLPSQVVMKEILPEHFILFKPRDIVSGDFYWISDHLQHFYLAVSDCTGHGVPGAFMSMLGMTFLNEIIGKQPGIDPDELLNELRSRIIQTLHQEGEPGTARDGMDMVIFRFHRGSGILSFAGANNPLYLIRDDELKEFKNDKMPVSIHDIMKPYRQQAIDIQPGDCVYLFSDGYADQFGGPDGKKMKYRAFKKLILDSSGQPMAKQKTLLNSAFEEWRRDLEQIDDVTVFGIRFPEKS